MYKKITCCRVCGNSKLLPIINLGEQCLTGVFPLRDEIENLESGPLELVKCVDGCGLVQLRHSFEPEKMYGDNYGYHSGLNTSMISHLNQITSECKERVHIEEEDLILDIGSNDGTLLGTWLDKNDGKHLLLVGIDPTGKKFKKYYREGIELITDFFSSKILIERYGKKKAKVVTSIAMFYDLEQPVVFARNVSEILSIDGVWVMEQSYLPLMIKTNSYDTICHEHLEFYSLKQIRYIAEKADLKIIDVSTNTTNGGSFRVTLAKKGSLLKESVSVKKMIDSEINNRVNELGYFDEFVNNINKHREKLIEFLEEQKKLGKLVLGYGASTKGNVVLQYCNINKSLLPAIAEVNEDKFGHVTPGTNISIISELEAKKMKPDYFLVLPWHFRKNILAKEKDYIKESGCKFVFCLPEFEII